MDASDISQAQLLEHVPRSLLHDVNSSIIRRNTVPKETSAEIIFNLQRYLDLRSPPPIGNYGCAQLILLTLFLMALFTLVWFARSIAYSGTLHAASVLVSGSALFISIWSGAQLLRNLKQQTTKLKASALLARLLEQGVITTGIIIQLFPRKSSNENEKSVLGSDFLQIEYSYTDLENSKHVASYLTKTAKSMNIGQKLVVWASGEISVIL